MNFIAKVRSVVGLAMLLAAVARLSAMPPHYDEKLRVVQIEANGGNPEAQFLLGLRYGAGDGVREDQARAENWLRTAAESGLVEAQSALGELYLISGPGYEPEAGKWLTRAADQGDVASTTLLESFSAKGGPGAQAQRPEALLKEAQPAGPEMTRSTTERADTAFVPPRSDRPSKPDAPVTFQREAESSFGWETWVLGVAVVATLTGLLVGRRS